MMNLTIWKFPLPEEEKILKMPKGAKVLSVQLQNGLPTLWALVDPTAELERRAFFVLGTGWKIPPEVSVQLSDFVGTIQLGPFVWHIFEGR